MGRKNDGNNFTSNRNYSSQFIHMRTVTRLIFTLSVVGALQSTRAQQINPSLLTNQWPAFWIGGPAPAGGQRGPGGGFFGSQAPPEFSVYHFRKTFELAAKPASFIVHVSADNRYKLYVNGTQVAHGPAASSPKYWNFETVDLAPYLRQGKNSLGALVWHGANFTPVMQMSTGRMGFILQGNGDAEKIANSDNTWKVLKSTAYKPVRAGGQALGYIAIGFTEQVDYSNHPTGWESTEFDDSSWSAAGQSFNGATQKGSGNGALELLSTGFFNPAQFHKWK